MLGTLLSACTQLGLKPNISGISSYSNQSIPSVC